ncbi:uncharacterized protein LOC127809477 isoform X1 [Diospyros lotus]|uniref:uncharacterized protein LOC127809477 isoform X1 n=1 Tax=Diospyros lotus TaxID=55363 RepID=UPI0022556A44|nr:uncharacterized protein LOC127809477 isoform X1 [Diospyros lotus]XP_052204256.1 uncharacterized protein LOC127809477 isoform X1 [Diospyros lotus]
MYGPTYFSFWNIISLGIWLISFSRIVICKSFQDNTISVPSPPVTTAAPAFLTNSFPSLSSQSCSFIGPFLSISVSASPLQTSSGFNSGLNSANTQSSLLSVSVGPSFTHTNALFPQPYNAPFFSQPKASNAQPVRPQVGENLFSIIAPLFSVNNLPGCTHANQPSLSTPLQPTLTTQLAPTFTTSHFPQSSTGLRGFESITSGCCQSTFSQLVYLRSDAQSTVPVQPAPNVSPFGALPTMARLDLHLRFSTEFLACLCLISLQLLEGGHPC